MRLLFAFIFAPLCLLADTATEDYVYVKPETKKPKGPWLTGPLLTASAYTIPKNHFNIEPYVFFSHTFGAYGLNGNVHTVTDTVESILSIEIIQIGLSDRIDLTLYPQFVYNYDGNDNQLAMGDITIGTSFQLIRDDANFYGLTAKIGLEQVFPCSRFDNLDPELVGVQGIGGGAWTTSLYLSVYKMFHFGGEHFLAARAAVRGNFFVPFYLHGHSVFGGDETTRGKIARGASGIFSVGLEYTLSLNWAAALDIQNIYATGSTFTGRSDTPIGDPNSSYLLSLAPALEYNFSKNYGIIFGAWFTVFGLNTESFLSFVVALNMYI